ncbi:SMI1/KNR4 family protein [Paenibacillus tyrfis]|uniref:SMI1/KNR4 family protein n=1 Tax=Paenibacillus tyrfis TaxID=1501230 RepID=UPI00209D4A2E|nr:SMI1/KNR4 family protein [Paenibacillus tyrfis]MCP1308545.1 SMI1/KNR4 family protein [Paenibacillus tyrfis]
MERDLLEQLNLWHEEDEFENIIDRILEIPERDRDYDCISHLARAMNNLERYEEALQQLLTIEKRGENDPLWHFRAGYAYYYLEQYEDAVREFETADQLAPNDETTLSFLAWSRQGLTAMNRKRKRSMAMQARNEQVSHTGAGKAPFEGFDLTKFWDDSDYALKEYVSEPPTDELIASIEQELGYKLPASYIAMMKLHNGGVPINTCFPTEEATSWAEDHIAITGIMGIGREKPYSLCGELGSPFMIEEWGYPDIGVVICDCPSAGHDVVMLDYRKCGRHGEPEVIHVDQEGDYEITFLAENFEAFIRGLVHHDVYDTSEEDKQEDLRKVAHEEFSPLLSELCARVTEVDNIEEIIRAICTRIVEEKGYFAFHADEFSTLMYDLQFWLYTKSYPDTSREQYLKDYSKMIAFGGSFSTGGYAPGFITDWLDDRLRQGMIVGTSDALTFTDAATKQLLEKMKAFASAT